MSAAALEPHRAPARASEPIRLLLVDDDAGIRRAFTRTFTRAGFAVTTACDGANAMTLIAEREFDVILSDITMPAMNGMQMLALVRSRNPDMPVILMTAGPSLETAVAAVEGGAFRYVFKPTENDALVGILHLAVKSGREAVARRAAAAAADEQRTAAQLDRARLEGIFRRSLAAVEMSFQPIVSLADRRTVAYEALLRSREPGMSRPFEILEAAESLDLLHELGRTVRGAVASSFDRLPEAASMFVNLHPCDLLDEQLYEPASPLSAFAPRVVLEITERASTTRSRTFPTACDACAASASASRSTISARAIRDSSRSPTSSRKS